MVSVGDTFQFFSPEGQLRVTFTVLTVVRVDSSHELARVLVVDRTELAEHFRAAEGETTDWVFNQNDPEWEQLRRVA